MNNLLHLLSLEYEKAQRKLNESISPLIKIIVENNLYKGKIQKNFETLESVIEFINIFVNHMYLSHTNDALNMFDCCKQAKSFYEHKRKEKGNNIFPPIIYTETTDKKSQEYIIQRDKCNEFFSNLRIHKLGAIIPHILYENALKYSPKEVAGNITTKFSIIGPNKGLMQVSNLGPHVKENEIEKIFESQYRGSNAFSAFPDEGFGLGLNFIKEIITAHGGEVYATPGENITYYNNIPYSEFTISIVIDIDKANNNPSITMIDSAKTIFLHEYNHILTSLHRTIECIQTISEHNLKNKDIEDLSSYFDAMTNASFFYELSLMKYVFALDKSFIQFSSPTSIELKSAFIRALDYYKESFAHNEISVDAQIIQKGQLRFLGDKRLNINDNRAEDININAIDKTRDIPLLIIDLINMICIPKGEIIITLTPYTVFKQRRLNIEILFTRKLGYMIDKIKEIAPTAQCTIEYINYILSNNKSEIIKAENYEDDKIRIDFDI